MYSMEMIPRHLPLVLISHDVLLPGSALRIPMTTSRNLNVVKSRLLSENTLHSAIIGVVSNPSKELANETSGLQCGVLGTVAVVSQVSGTNWPQPEFTLLATGLVRFRLDKLIMEEPYFLGSVTVVEIAKPCDEENKELQALITTFKLEASKLLDLMRMRLPIAAMNVKGIVDTIPYSWLVDMCASAVSASYEEKLDILNTPDLTERFKKILPLVARQIKVLEDQTTNSNKKTAAILHSMVLKQWAGPGRKIVVRSRGGIGDELEGGDDTNVIAELLEKLKKAKLPVYAHSVALKNLQRLKKMGPFSPEHSVIRNYVELMSELPWSVSSNETVDIKKAKLDLDVDHYGMTKLKRRVLEYLAVRQLRGSALGGPILCFVGPPGVGKTSIGSSIARTLGRQFHRISLGGVNNQAEIRGHRMTYIAAMPGRIIQALKRVGVNNPVILLDEIDKMNVGTQGDPASALLEVLDPEQNCNFVDHYLNVPFDLSQVIFIATANTTRTISAPLYDRMEIISVPGYTQEEKVNIAVRHLLSKQLSKHGLDSSVMTLPEDSIRLLISGYTWEGGVRHLERKLGALCRTVAMYVAESNTTDVAAGDVIGTQSADFPIVIDEAKLEDILGPPPFSKDQDLCIGVPGVAVGLSWTSNGGELLLIEASKMVGIGELMMTGLLGNAMRESTLLALNWVRTVAEQYNLTSIRGDLINEMDVHIHFPAGAVNKEGPSAGVAIATALVSLFAELPVVSDLAITGELTLRGVVLPVGGIKEKVLAAHTAGLKRVIIPKRNQKDLVKLPDEVKNTLSIIMVSHMEEVLQTAFEGALTAVVNPSPLVSKL